MKLLQNQKGVADWVAVVATIVILAIIGLVIAAVSSMDTTTPPSQAPGAENTCFTYCLGLVELQCGDNQLIGACFGVWDCKAGIGAHPCK